MSFPLIHDKLPKLQTIFMKNMISLAFAKQPFIQQGLRNFVCEQHTGHFLPNIDQIHAHEMHTTVAILSIFHAI
jgi:hypothetical protein